MRYSSLIFLAVVCGFSCANFDNNLQTVEKGRFYRSAQMSGERLSWVIQRHGIRGVVNLRGAAPGEAWYDAEVAACEAAGVPHLTLGWSMRRLPEPESLEHLLDFFEKTEGPLLVHCQGGVHRSAVAAACYRLMRGDTPDEARAEFKFFFRNAPIGELIDLYEKDGRPFADWVREVYPAVYAERYPSALPAASE